jgi:hypothetical protein
MNMEIVRLLRTPHSERFALRRGNADVAVVDLHYMSDQRVSATLIVFEDSGVREGEIPEILTWLDELLLPDVSLGKGNLVFTVVVGKVLGAYSAEPQVPGAGKTA